MIEKIYIIRQKWYNNKRHLKKKIIAEVKDMTEQDLSIILNVKKDRLVRIARRRIRHKTEEEKQKYEKRYEQTMIFIGEITMALDCLADVGYMGKVAAPKLIEILSRQHEVTTLVDGRYVKLYRREDNSEYLLILDSVSPIENFKWSKSS